MGTLVEPLYDIRLPADWIARREPDLAAESAHADAPYFFLLVDYQEKVEDERIESYTRSLEKINDASRIEDASLFIRELQSDSERLIFHGADIIRGGERFSALDPDNIEIYRRETGLESHITNQRQTVSLSIDDLRVGDLLDLHYTVTERAGAHPLRVKHYYANFWLTWSCPVVQQFVRIHNRSQRNLGLHHHRVDAGVPADEFSLLQPRQTFEREYPGLLPKPFPETAPDWWWTDCLQVCREQSWRQISRELFRYYREVGAVGDSIDPDDIDRIELVGERRQDALRIIRFVQNEIRYRGQNYGIYTHTPKPPAQVLTKGAGDCKDKSNLLRALLDAIGVETSLVLVNSDYGKSLGNLQPSARHFNHMIVRVSLDGSDYYFDPTAQKQAGDFENCAELDFGFALALAENGEDLQTMPYRISREVYRLTHVFDFRERVGRLTITREYRAERADNVRYRFGSHSAKQLYDEYLEVEREDSGLDLKPISPVTIVEDDLVENRLVTCEQYRITNLQTTHDDEPIELPTKFYRFLPLPSDWRFPLQTSLAGAGEHRIEIYYNGPPDLRPSMRRIDNPAFTYEDSVRSKGNVALFRTRLTPRCELIDRGELSQYKSDVEELLGRRINRFPWAVEAEPEFDEKQEAENLRKAILWVVYLGFAAWLWLT